ncbi:MAG: fluoride efflux transporter CrcB [Alicyclobacillaceae bacterium]|nr:fluoride efflux transporter CrcB [Alicyclobacillaceae bacterium]
MTWLWVILGGVVGTWARFAVGAWVARRWTPLFPYGTWLINLSGSLFLGWLYAQVSLHRISEDWYAAAGSGFCGAYTTFSTFCYETLVLWREGSRALAIWYVLGSLYGGLVAGWFGLWLGTRFF